MIVAGHYGFTLVVRVSVRRLIRSCVVNQSVFSFPDDNLSKCQWISTKLGICIDIDLVLDCFFGRFRQFMEELSAGDMSVVSFQDDNLRKYQWNFTKFGVCIDIASGQISSLLTELSASDTFIFSFLDNNVSKISMDFHQT